MAKKKITSVVIEQSRANIFIIVNRLDGRNMHTCNIYQATKSKSLQRQEHWLIRGMQLLNASLQRNWGGQ